MATVKILVEILYIIVCIAMVIVVLMQEGKTSGLGALSGAADTYWGKNKGRSVEGNLIKVTRVLGILFVGLSIVLTANWLG